MDHKYTRDDFEEWLIFMDEYIDDFVSSLPTPERENLNYSPESLDVVERWLLIKYESNQTRIEAFRQKENRYRYMGAMCYVGETIRKNLGGIWNAHFDEPHYQYGELPIIESRAGAAICPLKLMNKAIEMRARHYLRQVLMPLIERGDFDRCVYVNLD
jgi:hypothetical protein